MGQGQGNLTHSDARRCFLFEIWTPLTKIIDAHLLAVQVVDSEANTTELIQLQARLISQRTKNAVMQRTVSPFVFQNAFNFCTTKQANSVKLIWLQAILVVHSNAATCNG